MVFKAVLLASYSPTRSELWGFGTGHSGGDQQACVPLPHAGQKCRHQTNVTNISLVGEELRWLGAGVRKGELEAKYVWFHLLECVHMLFIQLVLGLNWAALTTWCLTMNICKAANKKHLIVVC